MARPRSSEKKPRIVLFTLDDVPVARRLREVIPASDPVRRCVHYAYAKEHSDLAALLRAVPEADLDDGVAENVMAIDDALAELFRPESLLGEDGELVCGFHPGVEIPRAAKLLQKGGFAVVQYADFMRERLAVESRDEALARATEAFEASIPAQPLRAALLAFLRGEAAVAPGAALRSAEATGDASVSDVCQAALGPVVERWNPEITGRVLDLWVAARGPFDRLSLDQGEDELGADRAGALADALEARGVHPAIAFLSGATWGSRARSSRPPGSRRAQRSSSAALELDASAGERDERTTPDVASALFDVGRPLTEAPLVKQVALALLTSASTPPRRWASARSGGLSRPSARRWQRRSPALTSPRRWPTTLTDAQATCLPSPPTWVSWRPRFIKAPSAPSPRRGSRA